MKTSTNMWKKKNVLPSLLFPPYALVGQTLKGYHNIDIGNNSVASV